MTIFNRLESFMFDKDAFHLNTTSPLNIKYWKQKSDTLTEPNMAWVSTLEQKFFYSIFRGSVFNIFQVIKDETAEMKKEPRTAFFDSEIHLICSDLLSSVSGGLRKGEILSSNEIIVKLRWYIFEAAKMEEQYKRLLLSTYEKHNRIDSSSILTVCNYFTSVTLKLSLMLVYRQISIIDNIVITDWKEDSFLRNLLTENFDKQTFNSMLEYTLKNLNSDNAYLQDLYVSLRNMYFNSYQSNELSTVNEFEIRNTLAKIENLIFVRLILPDFLEVPLNYTIEQAIDNDNNILSEVYENIKGELMQFKLPTDAIFLIQNKIKPLKTILEITSDESELFKVDSIPRNLLTRLELELQTLIANPQIDVRVLYELSIKPIETTLSIPQLALLFRILVDEKLVKLNGTKADFFRSVTKLFQSKNSSRISEDSFKNKYNSPESHAIEFWDDKFNDLRDNVLDYKN